MRALAIALVIACSGCATTWILVEAGGAQRGLDEHGRDERVPQPGIEERLSVAVPLVTEYTTVPGTTAGTTTTGPAKPFALTCTAEQRAKSVQYHSAFRYGRTWKKATAIAFLVEGAIASIYLLTADSMHPNNYIYGGFLGVDAAITGAIFFIPQKEVYREEPIADVTQLRSDCPDGLALDIAGTRYPVDAAGRIGELGEAALDAWMQAPGGPIRAVFDEQAVVVPIGAAEQCAYLRDHHQQSCQLGVAPPRQTTVTIEVAAGTLTAAR